MFIMFKFKKCLNFKYELSTSSSSSSSSSSIVIVYP
jgi:hypothetical protein